MLQSWCSWGRPSHWVNDSEGKVALSPLRNHGGGLAGETEATGDGQTAIESAKFVESQFTKTPSLLSALLSLAAAQVAGAYVVWWVLSSYYGLDVPGSLIYRGDDGWCRPEIEGVGVHCFGDFNERVAQHSSDFVYPAWPTNLETSPLGPVITWLANLVSSTSNPRVALLGAIAIYAGALLLPIIAGTWWLGWRSRLASVALLGVATYPFLVAIDRLNILALATIPMYFFVESMRRGNWLGVASAIVLMTTVKPVFILLAVVFIAQRQWLRAITTAAAAAAAALLLIAGAGRWDGGRISEWFSVAAGYGTTMWEVSAPNPPNASLARLFFLQGRSLDWCWNLVFEGHLDTSALVERFGTLTGVAVAGALLLLLIITGRRLNGLVLGICVLALVSTSFGVYTAAYYLAFALPVTASLIQRWREQDRRRMLEGNQSVGSDSWDRAVMVALLLSFTLIPIPATFSGALAVPGLNVVEHVGPNLAVGAWVVVCVMAIASTFRTGEGQVTSDSRVDYKKVY